jgi:hypothetical protein
MEDEADTIDTPGDGLTPDQFDAALKALGWKATDFCRKAGVVPNTAWRWRKGHAPIPLWVGEYLRAVLAIQDLHARFVAVQSVRAAASS